MANPSSPASPEEKGAPPSPPPMRQPGEVIDLRYRVVKELGSGGMGSVFLVEDLLNANRLLALKQLRRDRAGAKSASILKNEFLALSQLIHPNLARVFDFGHDRRTSEYFFTSEYVDGIQLLKATRHLNMKDRGELLKLLGLFVDILRALEFIHSRGLVHGDIKPGNILAAAKPPASEGAGGEGGVVVKLIDFGLTKREKDFGGKKIFGTSYYIAPETILGVQVDRRTDLYSLGMVLFQVLTRALPFQGQSNLAILKWHLETEPLPPQYYDPAVPEEFSRILLRLLQKKPADRYPSANAVIQDLNQLFSAQFPLETPETIRSYLKSSPCLFRAQQLEEFKSLFHTVFKVGSLSPEEGTNLSPSLPEAARDGDHELPPPPASRFFLIRGEPGIGKRRLVKEFKRYVEIQGVNFIKLTFQKAAAAEKKNLKRFLMKLFHLLSGQSGGKPGPFDRPLELYLKWLGQAGGPAAPPAEGGPALPLVPVSPPDCLPALAKGLLEACQKTPLVLVFFQLEHAEEEFLKILRTVIELIVKNDRPQAQILFLAAVREDELETPAMRRHLLAPEIRSHLREIALERFDREELERVVESMFGPRQFPPEFLGRLYEESDGNAGVLHEILEYFIGNQKLARSLEGWKYTGDIEKEYIPAKMRRELKARIHNLDPEARQLGLSFAVYGNACELAVATQLAGIQPGKIIQTLLTLKKERLLRDDGEGKTDRFSFTHRSARDIFYQMATQEERLKIHLRAGELLEERLRQGQEDDPRKLAYHFLRAGKSEKGIRYGLAAAKRYTSIFHPRKAIEIYREVLEQCLDDQPLYFELNYQLARLESLVGNTRVAMLILQSLQELPGPVLAGSPDCEASQADVLIELADAERRLGEYRKSGQHFQEAYELLKGKGTTPSLLRLLLGFATLFRDRGSFVESLRYCERVEASQPVITDLVFKGHLHLRTAENHLQLGNSQEALQYYRTGLKLLDGRNEAGFVALTLYYLGGYFYCSGKFENSLKQYRLCSTLMRKLGLLQHEADCHRHLGALHLLLNQPGKARLALDHALELYEQTEDAWGSLEVLKHLGEAHRLLGRYEEAETFLGQALGANDKLENPKSFREICFTCSRICIDRGDLPKASKYLGLPQKKPNPQWDEHEMMVLNNLELQCHIALQGGNFQNALDLAARGIIYFQEVKNQMLAVPILELRAQLYLLLGKYSEVDRTLNQLKEVGRRLLLPVVEGRALLLEGKILLSSGDFKGSCSAFDKALAIFKEKQSERDLAQIYLEYGLALLKHGLGPAGAAGSAGGNSPVEQIYVFFEEGFYLTKKLNLIYLRCRYLMAMGRLEAQIKEGDSARAERYLQNAEKLARQFQFMDLIWQIYYLQSDFYFKRGFSEAGQEALSEAVRFLGSLIQGIPGAFRESYLSTSGAQDLYLLYEPEKGKA
ncbi:MAG: protein kinase [Planctomycetes bacterium]|nr:protein kinase [Planctomycetota bacterium]